MPHRSTTPDDKRKISKFLEDRHICKGAGTSDESCSITSINLALTGELTDKIPDCMSEVIGKWVIIIQDGMPDEMRNSPEWRSLLPPAAGTGRDRETERLNLILAWMWNTVLPQLQGIADKNGFGTEWRSMIEQKTYAHADAADRAAADAADAARAAACANAARAADAADAADRAARAAAAVAVDAFAAHAIATDVAAAIATRAAADAARAAACATRAAARAARTADRATFWQRINPCKLLSQLITL